MVRTQQTEVMHSSGRNTAEAAMHWSSWGIVLVGLFYIALLATPASVKTDNTGAASGWFFACSIVVVVTLLTFLAAFWRHFVVRARLVYTLQSVPPQIILAWSLLVFGIQVAYPSPGFEWTDPLAGGAFLLFGILALTLDACDCSRRFHVTVFTLMFCGTVFGAVMSSFVW
jgi:hypothetical protein